MTRKIHHLIHFILIFANSDIAISLLDITFIPHPNHSYSYINIFSRSAYADTPIMQNSKCYPAFRRTGRHIIRFAFDAKRYFRPCLHSTRRDFLHYFKRYISCGCSKTPILYIKQTAYQIRGSSKTPMMKIISMLWSAVDLNKLHVELKINRFLLSMSALLFRSVFNALMLSVLSSINC